MPQQQQFSGNPFMLGDSERGSYDYSGMTPDEAQTQRNISQRRQMAKLMMYQGQQQAGKKGGMVGNIYVKASPMEGLAGVGQVGLGGLADYFLNKESTEETKNQAKDRKARIDEYIAATTDTPAVPASKPLRPESYTDSNLSQIIKETRPETPPVDPNVPELSLRPMNKVSQTMMDMQVKAPQRLSPEQEKFALRFGEGQQDPYAGGMMGDGSGPSVAGTPFQPGAYMPAEIGPETPGTPGIIRSQGDIMRAGLKAFAYGDPRLDKLVSHVTDQRNQQEQAKLMREDRLARDTQANLERVSRDRAAADTQRTLREIMESGLNRRADNSNTSKKAVTKLGMILDIDEALKGMDPASEDAKSLRDLRATLSTHAPGTTVNVDTRTEGAYGKAFAGDIATNDAKFRDAAVGASSLAERANRVSELLHSDTVFTGTAAEFKLQFVKAAKALGLTNSDSAAATEALVQELAGNTLDSIKSSGLGTGQGFTDKDLKFLEGAKSGRIVFEKETIQRLSDLSYKAATKSRSQWDTRKKTIPSSALAGTGLDQEQLPEMPARYAVPANPAAAGGIPSAGAGWSLELK